MDIIKQVLSSRIAIPGIAWALRQLDFIGQVTKTLILTIALA